ncbi:MAG: glycogen synthase GlgA [Acidobacteriota bacterium]
MRVLVAASEVAPFAKTGGLADVAASLPKALKAMGHDVLVAMPMYAGIFPDGAPVATLDVPINHSTLGCAIYRRFVAPDLPVFMIDHKAFYDREGIYGTRDGPYWDNAARFAYFSRAVCEMVRLWLPSVDVVHANDWQTAMIPVFMRTHYASEPKFLRTATVFTIHNMGYQGIFHKDNMRVLELPWSYFTKDCLEYHDSINFLKGGVVFADLISTVSRRYGYEIQTPEGGCGLDSLMRSRSRDVAGIVNGVDYDEWNPATDMYIRARYNPENLHGKFECKRDLLGEFGQNPDYQGPVIGIISRMADQKGFDLIAQIAYRLMDLDCFIAVLGSGQREYEDLFRALAHHYPHKAGARIMYDNALAHRIEAGADMFLMPSRYEPCGLNQIYSLKYGTIPIVRATGGLDDTIEDYDPDRDTGTGFKFYGYSGEELYHCILRALDTYGDRHRWWRMQMRAMRGDFSWSNSARQYADLYDRAQAQHISFIH